MSAAELWPSHQREHCLAWTLGEFGVACRGLHQDTVSTTDGQFASGISHVVEIDGPDGVLLELRDFRQSGRHFHRHVLCSARHGSPERFDRLKHGGRLWVAQDAPGQLHVSLKILAWDREDPACVGFARKRGADLVLLEKAAGMDPAQALRSVGATRVIQQETNLYRADFPEAELRVPIAAYLLTRVMPVWRSFSG